MDIAIVGAGMAGLSCADSLVAAGHRVTLFDKGRGPGGRMSSRRAETPLGQCRFDHGAPSFSPRNGPFQAAVDAWMSAGAVALWQGRFVSINSDGVERPASDAPRYVGTPAMNSIVRHLADRHAVAWARRVSSISGAAGNLTLSFEDGAGEGPFSAVVVAIPAEQAGDFLETCAPAFAADARAVASAPCWAVMAAFNEPLAKPYDAARFETGPLHWAGRNASKPGRSAEETWVLHATADWSQTHIDDDAGAVADTLLENFAPSEPPVFAAAHRWRFSQVINAAGTTAAWDESRGIGVCGDWLCGNQIEDAWTSGRALAALIG